MSLYSIFMHRNSLFLKLITQSPKPEIVKNDQGFIMTPIFFRPSTFTIKGFSNRTWRMYCDS